MLRPLATTFQRLPTPPLCTPTVAPHFPCIGISQATVGLQHECAFASLHTPHMHFPNIPPQPRRRLDPQSMPRIRCAWQDHTKNITRMHTEFQTRPNNPREMVHPTPQTIVTWTHGSIPLMPLSNYQRQSANYTLLQWCPVSSKVLTPNAR